MKATITCILIPVDHSSSKDMTRAFHLENKFNRRLDFNFMVYTFH